MFDESIRDKFLFEDDYFTYSRRYFWGYQTLNVIREELKKIIGAYKNVFGEKMWNGRHLKLWPAVDDSEPRTMEWTRQIASLRRKLEGEINQLEGMADSIDDTRKNIRELRDQLFSGTSVMESRKYVQMSGVTILQGHNIKLLTLVSYLIGIRLFRANFRKRSQYSFSRLLLSHRSLE